MGRLDGKVAIVTGASQGLGVEIVKLFAYEGASVVGTARRENMVQKVMDELAEEGYTNTLALHQDVGCKEEWDEVIRATVEKFGKVDILVNNAALIIQSDILTATEDDMITAFKTNTLSMVYGLQSVVPEFEKLGKGSVVNVNSLAGLTSGDADNNSAPYSASKGAARSLTRHAAYYLAPKKVRVNSVHPGAIQTPMLEKALAEAPEVAARVEMFNPLPPHISGARDIANAVLYLASDDAACVTGAELVVDCGHMVL